MEKTDLEYFPISESAKNMLASVSDGFYDNSYVMKWLYEVMGREYDSAREIAEDLANQAFIETATWGLMYHEIKWGLPVRKNLSYEARRQLIYMKRDYRAPITPVRMEDFIKNQFGLEAEVSDAHDAGSTGYVPPHPNVFQITIWDRGQNMILDYGALERLIDHIKQSHTTFSINHRQIFNRNITVYTGAVTSEFVEYDVKARKLNRDIEVKKMVVIGAVTDMAVFEEIPIGGM